MKKIALSLLTCVLILSITKHSIGQIYKDTLTLGPVKTKIVTLSIGYSSIDVAELNQFLAPTTTGSFSSDFGMLGLHSITECKRFIYGFTLQAGMSMRNTSNNYAGVSGQNMDYYVTHGNFLIHGGYSILSTKRVKLYPMLGAGIGGTKANFNRVDNLTIAQFANNPSVQGEVGKAMACFDAALNVDFLMPSKRWSTINATYGRVISLRVGYTQGIGIGSWGFKGARIVENPTYNPGMFYAKLHFGMFSTKAKNCGADYKR